MQPAIAHARVPERTMRKVKLALALAMIAGCVTGPPVDPPDVADIEDEELPSLEWQLVHSGLVRPTDLQAPRDGSSRLFLIEQPGRIRISDGGILQSADDAFLDITDLVADGGPEQGLLGMALHPEFAANGRFYVNYTQTADAFGGAGDTVIAEYQVSADPASADPDSARVLIRIPQPLSNHNAGQLAFGPDGMLYVGTGDGGGSCDSNDVAQDPGQLLGKMLRLDVHAPPRFIPADNPFVSSADIRDEIWARGLRNPWRFSFDPATELLYIADVGQNSREEVSVVNIDLVNPPNLGWRTVEGTLSPPAGCPASNFELTDPTPPLIEYDHGTGCSIVGGHVYRGAALPSLHGAYFYSDFCAGFIRTARIEDDQLIATGDLTDKIAQPDAPLNSPTSFGLDESGELYVLDQDGDVFKLARAQWVGDTRNAARVSAHRVGTYTDLHSVLVCTAIEVEVQLRTHHLSSPAQSSTIGFPVLTGFTQHPSGSRLNSTGASVRVDPYAAFASRIVGRLSCIAI
jgi:hypothetical protein